MNKKLVDHLLKMNSKSIKEFQKKTRKNFLKETGILMGSILGGKYLIESIDKKIKKINENKIYNELPSHIHRSVTEFKIGLVKEDKYEEIIQKGDGIVLGDKYITVAHITSLSQEDIRGRLRKYGPVEIKEKKVRLYEEELEELVCNTENDVAIYQLPEELRYLSEFPCKPTNKVSLGDNIYVLGNPRLGGRNIRKGKISSLKGNKTIIEINLGKEESFFGIDKAIIPGDSGTPIVNEDYELIGLASIRHYELGYIKYIGEFTKEIEKIERDKNTIDKIIELYYDIRHIFK